MKLWLPALVGTCCLVSAAFAAAPATKPATNPATRPVQVTVDTSDAPELEEYGKKIKTLSEEWYPKIVTMLPSEGFVAPDQVTIAFKKDYNGVAAAGGTRITCSVKYYKDHPDDLGSIVHELTHVVQRYRRGPKPGWLVEGIADYIRFYNYEPVKARPNPNPARAKHTDSYRTSAHFLNWAQEKYDKGLVLKLNTACREAKYSEDLWKQYTGKTLEELGAEWKESLPKRQ